MENKIDVTWLTRMTGDPFADVGGRVIQFLSHMTEHKNESILQLIEYAADIYIDIWDAKLHPFFLNSTITQAQFVGDRKKQETVDYFASLLNEEIASKKGYCEITGRNTTLYPAGRNNQILTGSGTFVNCHFGLQPGIYLCKEMIIRMFFIPLGVHRLADKIALITSNNDKVGDFFVFQNCISNLHAIKNKASTGPLKSIFNNPANALFRFVDDYFQHLNNSLNTEERNDFDPAATRVDLFHFSNLGQKPEMVSYTLDNDVFRFYAFCNSPAIKNYWQDFIYHHYNPGSYKRAVFNQVDKKWETTDGEEITFEEYAKWKNLVLMALLHHLPLIRYFLKWSEFNILPLEIIKKYQTMMRKMSTESVNKIGAIASFIVEQGHDYIEEVIEGLNNVMTRSELRKVFLKMQELAYQKQSKEAIISAQEYADHLFVAGSYWTELRDLLIISIYQTRN